MNWDIDDGKTEMGSDCAPMETSRWPTADDNDDEEQR
jgi:hypothetical protein